MIWPQSGHLTQSPSGTRLGFSTAGAVIGLRVFLNQAILGSLTDCRMAEFRDCRKERAMRQLCRPAVSRSRSRHVVPRARPHRAKLLDQIVDGFVAGIGIELRLLDEEQRLGVVVEEEAMVRLVQFLQI